VKRVALSWSSGKDSAWALHILKATSGIEVVSLITTFNESADRVAMHAVRRELVQAQAESLDLPLWAVDLPWPCSNQVYEERMGNLCRRARADGIEAIAFGDLFLEEIRAYREHQLKPVGLKPLFPLWQIPTFELAKSMLSGGLKAKVTCIDQAKLDNSYLGRDFDADFLRDLPPGIDPCGENGEFHTFVYDAPVFPGPIQLQPGAIVERDGFAFADFTPLTAGGGHPINSCKAPDKKIP
jgi:uncharacterized protein (TIGR00290 family)